MGVYFEIVDFDHEFNNSPKIPTVLNDLEENNEKDKEFVNSCIYTRYTNDLLSNIPSCGCGAIVGQDNIGVICPECHTEVKSSIEDELEPLVWIRAPHGVKALINTTVWSILSERFSKSNFDVLRYICDVTYNPANRRLNVIEELRSINIPRGLNYFIEHFDEIIEKLLGLPSFRIKKGETEYILSFIEQYRESIFCQHIPIINRSILVFEDDNQGNFVDASVPGIVNAARIMVGIDVNENITDKQRENRAIKAIASLSDVYQKMNYDTFLSGKPGLLRKHIFGTRSYFSFRAVISSLTEAHHYRELHIPWGIAVSVLSIHVKSILLRRGMTINEANSFLFEHAQKYSPILDEIFKGLIAGSKYPDLPYLDVHTNEVKRLHGIPCTMARNPSLKINSIQLDYITKVKTDVDDPTVGIPILSVSPMNADFDGDALNFTLVLDGKMHELLENLSFDSSVFSLAAPFEVSSDLKYPKPIVSTVANWLNTEEDNPNPEKIQMMKNNLLGS